MEKKRLDRRLEQMVAEGTRFLAGVEVGGPAETDLTVEKLRADHDAVVLAVGATAWRDLPITGRELHGVHQAMEYLPPSNKVQQGDYERSFIDAEGKDVVIIGGGDTGADCLGTAHRQGARSVTQLEILPRPPEQRSATMPWPTYPMTYRISSAHEEGGDRVFAVSTQRFVGDADARVSGLVITEVDERFNPIEGTERELPCQLVLLAMGFVGPERGPLLDGLKVEIDSRGNVARGGDWMTKADGVFVCGDMGRGQSLIVWAIAEGRSCARGVDEYLMGRSTLPSPVA
jgi:glutamate synthase (NADPH/NADH) small chain